jgi:hypothetical protein
MANFYEKLRSSYGFIPSVMAIMAGFWPAFWSISTCSTKKTG